MQTKGQKNRGAKDVYVNGRGQKNLETAQKYSKHCILIEPFFGDNQNDYIPARDMARYLTEFINEL